MEEPSEDTCALAFDLFNRWGCLKEQFCEHPFKKGTGAWGRELDTGRLLLIETVRVDESHRHQEHGRALVDEVWEKASSACPGLQYAIAWPTLLAYSDHADEMKDLPPDESKLISQTLSLAAQDFFRAMGFRRVGSSCWFARTDNPAHPSRSLAPSDDQKQPLSLELAPFQKDQKYPYDAGIVRKSEPIFCDLEPVHQIPLRTPFLSTDDESTLAILEARLAACPPLDPAWKATDDHGNTIIHVVAMDCKVESLTWLLEQPFADDLNCIRNLEGETPLEALEASLDEHRVKMTWRMLTIPISDKYDGVRREELLCLLKLKGINPRNIIRVAHAKFGCTCGECIGGFLSPRLAFALECQGDIHHDMMDFEINTNVGSEWCSSWSAQLEHVRPDVRLNMTTNKSYRQGFTNLFGYVAECLRAKRLPTAPNVMNLVSEWPPNVNNYIRRGGTVAAVVLACFDMAIIQDKYLGDGDHELVHAEAIEKLPRCRNDREFAFARRQYRRIEGLQGDPIRLV